MENIAELQGVHYVYSSGEEGREGLQVLKGIDLALAPGTFTAIIGRNGSGKSTLMRTVLGLQAPLSGSIQTGDGLAQNEIGYLPQQTEVQRDFPASVAEIVISGCQARMGLRPFYTKDEKELAKKNMERMRITEFAGKCYRELSGGQQQRVLLARALCATQKCLLLDEPVSGLDPKVTAEMYALIDELNKDGITIIMISHDISAAVKYASHILHISQKVFFGTKEDYLNSPAGKLFLAQKGGENA